MLQHYEYAYLFLEHFCIRKNQQFNDIKFQPNIFPDTNDIWLSGRIVKKVPYNTRSFPDIRCISKINNTFISFQNFKLTLFTKNIKYCKKDCKPCTNLFQIYANLLYAYLLIKFLFAIIQFRYLQHYSSDQSRIFSRVRFS